MGVQLGHHHRTGLGQHPHDRCVGRRRRCVGQYPRAAPGRQPGHVDDVLDPDRHPVQRSAAASRGELLGQHRRCGQRPVAVQGDHRVAGVGRQPVKHLADVLQRSQLAAADPPGDVGQPHHRSTSSAKPAYIATPWAMAGSWNTTRLEWFGGAESGSSSGGQPPRNAIAPGTRLST